MLENVWKSAQEEYASTSGQRVHWGAEAEKAGLGVGPLIVTVIIYFFEKTKKDLKQKWQNIHINYIRVVGT